MKKFIITLVALIATVAMADAQLRVLNSGNIVVGDWTPVVSSGPSMSTASPDTTAIIAVAGSGDSYSGGKISFGSRRDVSVGESLSKPLLQNNKGCLNLVGNGGMSYVADGKSIMSYNPRILSAAVGRSSMSFTVPVSATQFFTTSDSRYKKNIESIENMGRLLDGVTPVSYVLDIDKKTDMENGEASKVSAQTDTKGTVQFGFLAQEVREIFPELVHEDAEGMLSIDYNGFIPLLVDAVKNLQAKVEAQEAVIEQLTAPSVGRKSVAGVEGIDGENAISMSQNRPNPFRETTEIKCHLPETVGTAFLCVYDLNGRQQLRQDIDSRGDVTVTISGSTLAPGLYIYSLIADGIEAATKRMILTD